jgi:hypothetical protein
VIEVCVRRLTIDSEKAKIKKWLAEEGTTYTINHKAGRLFSFTVNDPERKLAYDVDMMDSRPDSVVVFNKTALSPEDKIAYARLGPLRKSSFVRAIRQSLPYLDIEYRFSPDEINLDSIYLARTIYLDGLSKDKFFNTVATIWRAYNLLIEAYRDYLWFNSERSSI